MAVDIDAIRNGFSGCEECPAARSLLAELDSLRAENARLRGEVERLDSTRIGLLNGMAGADCRAEDAERERDAANARAKAAETEAGRLRRRKDEAYTERNTVVALLARLVIASGGVAGRRRHEPDPDPSWDPEWLTLVAIDLPSDLTLDQIDAKIALRSALEAAE
jgi:hypothetical protein